MSAHRLWMKSGASGRAIDFNHTAIENDRDNQAHGFHGKGYNPGFQHECEQITQLHCLELGGNIRYRCGNINASVGVDDTSAPLHHGLCDIENRYDEIKGMINDDCRRC